MTDALIVLLPIAIVCAAVFAWVALRRPAERDEENSAQEPNEPGDLLVMQILARGAVVRPMRIDDVLCPFQNHDGLPVVCTPCCALWDFGTSGCRLATAWWLPK